MFDEIRTKSVATCAIARTYKAEKLWGAGFFVRTKAILTIAVFVMCAIVNAAEITAEQSRMAVEAWIRKCGSMAGKTVLGAETIAAPQTGSRIHVVSLGGGGFVVTPADDRISPVMAYSETGAFANDPENPLLQLVQADVSAVGRMFATATSGLAADETRKVRPLSAGIGDSSETRTAAQKEWDELLGRTISPLKSRSGGPAAISLLSPEPSSVETRVKPILETEWGQATHNNHKEDSLGGEGLLCFNYYTPVWPVDLAQMATAASGNVEAASGDDGRYSTRYPCGCVATAGAQIMWKWKHPGNYDFGSMPVKSANTNGKKGRMAIGRLTRDIGDACDAQYGPETAMSTETMVEKLETAFSYSGAFWQYTTDADFLASDGEVCPFDRQVIPNLIAGWPVSMKLQGHSAVVDGLRYVGSVRKIHVNFGWNGKNGVQSNTWYVPQTFVTSAGTYTSVKGIGINIHPTKRKAIIAGRVSASVRSNTGLSILNGGLKGAAVVLRKNGNVVDSCRTDRHGQFFFLVDGGTYVLDVTKAGYAGKTVEGVTVTCSGSSVRNYYNDGIFLEAGALERVGNVGIAEYPMEDGSWYRISMSCATEGASIRYTIDGSLPTEDDPLYSGELSLRESGVVTLKAIAFKEGMLPSEETSEDISFKTSARNVRLQSASVIEVSEGRLTMDNGLADNESGEPSHSVMGKDGGASMWFSFIAPEDGYYTFAASGLSAVAADCSLDTQLAVYTGSSIDALTLVVANDDVDAGGYDLSSKVSFKAARGTAYCLAVDTRNGEKGTINLEWRKGCEDIASPMECNIYCTAKGNAYSIPVRSTAAWRVCDGSDWIAVKKDSGIDGESLVFELPGMTEGESRSGVLILCAGDEGPCSTIRITQGTTSWVTSRADALAMTKTTGKRILMVCGRNTNSDTTYTRFTACEDETVKSLLLEGYVLWYCDYDEYWDDCSYYAVGLGSYTLPLVCIIDPATPDKYVARSTGRLTAASLKKLLDDSSEGDLPARPFDVHVRQSDAAGTLYLSWSPARHAQAYEIWRGTSWNPAEAVRIASDVSTEVYADATVEPATLYYYRVRAVNGVGAGEMAIPVVGYWRVDGTAGDTAISDALGTPHLDWTTEGKYPWAVQLNNTYDGTSAMQSAYVDPEQDGVTSVLKTKVAGPTRMSFRYKTRMYFSRFEVKIDGKSAFLATGTVSDWTSAAVEIPAGNHEVAFSYMKDGYYTSGFNGVYLDAVQFDVASDPPEIVPVTTDKEESAMSFTGSLSISIKAPEGGAVYYTLDGSEPTLASQRYEGPFEVKSSVRVKAVCVQDGHSDSATVSALYLERHPVQAGEWTTDVEGVKKAASENGTIIVTMLADYETSLESKSFKEVSESARFLAWAKTSGVYLITADSSRAVDTETADNRFWDLFYDAGQNGNPDYPALAISRAREPDKACGFAVARPGRQIGDVTYDGSVETLESGLLSFFDTPPVVDPDPPPVIDPDPPPVVDPDPPPVVDPVPGTLTMTAEKVNGGGKMKVTVKRTGGSDGRIAVKLKTQDASTVNGVSGRFGVDFEYLKEILVWEDGDTADKVVHVQTVATDSTKAATLRLKMSVQTTGAYADCATPVLAGGGKVIATISPAKKGTISFVAPDPMSVLAGEPLKVAIRRTGGSDGRVAVKFKTQDASTVSGISAFFLSDFDYVKKYLVWEHGDASGRTVEVPTVAGWWTGTSKTFRLKLSVQTTGDYAGCVTPALADGGKVIASILPNETAYPGEVRVKSVESVRNGSTVSGTVTAAPFWGYAGDTLRVTVGRVGGDFGRVAVKVKTQDASTVNGIEARFVTDIGYEKETFVWEDGDVADRVLEIPTSHVDGAKYPRSFRLKLSAQTAGDYADCATPDIPDPKVMIGLIEKP